jgi:hypothetical protein
VPVIAVDIRSRRPKSATVIAWIWIVIAVGSLLSEIDAFFKARKLATARRGLGDDPDAEAILDRFAGLLGGTPLELVAVVFFASIVIAGAVGLLKLQPWGRRTIIAVTWLALVGMLIGQPLFLWEFTDLATTGETELTAFEVGVWIAGLVQLVFGIAIFGFMLRALHGKHLRDAVRGSGAH